MEIQQLAVGVIILMVITMFNLIGYKMRIPLLQVMGIIGLVFTVPYMFTDDPLVTALLVVVTLGNLAIVAAGFSMARSGA
jgi:hypothetical protein